jgi:hypothetical protein
VIKLDDDDGGDLRGKRVSKRRGVRLIVDWLDKTKKKINDPL